MTSIYKIVYVMMEHHLHLNFPTNVTANSFVGLLSLMLRVPIPVQTESHVVHLCSGRSHLSVAPLSTNPTKRVIYFVYVKTLVLLTPSHSFKIQLTLKIIIISLNSVRHCYHISKNTLLSFSHSKLVQLIISNSS